MNTSAVGIHDLPQLKLGLRPSDPTVKSLSFGDFLTGTLPEHPPSVDYLTGITFGLYGNDKWGVCGPTMVANGRREITARLGGKMVAPTQDDVFDLYRRSGNPNFNPTTGADDNGVSMEVMCRALVSGGIGGVKALAYAKVDVTDIEQLQAAVALGGFIYLAVNLQTAQQQQTTRGIWDYKPSGQWGGHAVLGGKYESNPETLDIITWANQVIMTEAFVKHQLMECWFVLWPEHLSDHGFMTGVNLYAFASAFEALTGMKFPVPVVPPAPTPTPPSPIPVPTGTGLLTIDPAAKRITYPAGWTAVSSARSEFDQV